MHIQSASFTAMFLFGLASAQDAGPSALATIDPAWVSQYDLSSVPDTAPRPVGSGTCPNSQCGPGDCENCWETCGNCPLADDIYGCQTGQWALTFDDGPSQYTSELLDILASANVKATFQIIGSNAVQYPDVVKRAYDEGHQIASHTWSHPHLMSLSTEQIVAEVKATENALLNITGAVPAYIRPPYGEADDRVKAIFKAMGYHTLLWNMDTLDWDISDKNESASLILDSFKSAIVSGTELNAHNDLGFISLQHDLYIDTVRQTPAIAQLLDQYSFHFVLAYECANLAPYQNTAMPSGTSTLTPNPSASTPSPDDNNDGDSTDDTTDTDTDTDTDADTDTDTESDSTEPDSGIPVLLKKRGIPGQSSSTLTFDPSFWTIVIGVINGYLMFA
ncbi:glycoside hydrolase/deacetylase [Basidiobolus meristosporus CBS 931.73]|uniref:Glycoside hydrolase/deacetylase n=1 Tax=Basidiobolus meristosporus CBS 931.73 TaxID=1314790 RepID=A0A1Y1XCL2_9FUNG|nr:glycoside hydrolase/deacetylase [Basidiobolus meristosporus CBS 931.73]|eukprot:ORX83510.1 glycoside hydrolase/deacetylase [Basidiobolus meristosporus CBS 931.73]